MAKTSAGIVTLVTLLTACAQIDAAEGPEMVVVLHVTDVIKDCDPRAPPRAIAQSVTWCQPLLAPPSTPSTGATLAAFPSTHVRSTNSEILDGLRSGYGRSATFKALVDQMSVTSTIVYIEHGICAFGHFKACVPHSIGIAGVNRLIRILVDPNESGGHELALIAHELQHSIEIALAPNIRTPDDLTRLFQRIGRPTHCPLGTPDCYETSAAIAAGGKVLHEIQISDKERRVHKTSTSE